jgi:ketosteroid isomerase-like protein
VSQENVELLRRGIEAWNRREVDVWLDLGTPDIEWMPAGPAAVERTVYRGNDEVRDGIEAVFETWEVFELQEGEVRDLGDSALWLGRVKMQASASGVELDQEFAAHAVMSDGKVTRLQTFLSWHEALNAAGLEE